MNLTYEDDEYYKQPSTGACTNAHLKMAAAYATAKNMNATSGQLGDVGSLISSLVKIKNNLTPSFIKSSKLAENLIDPADSLLYHSEQNAVLPIAGKYGNIIAPIASFFGPWGKLVSAAVTVVRADYVQTQNAAKALQAAQGDANTLLTQYDKVAGTIPGRVIGLPTLTNILKAGVVAGQWPPITQDNAKTPASQTFFANINTAAQQAIARGAQTANDAYTNEWAALIAKQPLAQWMLPHDEYGAQLVLDSLDAAMANINPNLPFSYGISDAAASDPSATTAVSNMWYKAADENQLVPFTGTRQVQFGANGKFVTKTITAQNGGVMCTDAVFGDPIFGTVKACYLLQSEDAPQTVVNTPSVQQSNVTPQWYKAADEHGFVSFTGTRQVRFGANGKFVTASMTAQNGGVQCEDAVFGDPIFGTVKACYLLNTEDAQPQSVNIPSALVTPTNSQLIVPATTTGNSSVLPQPVANAVTANAPVAATSTATGMNTDQQAAMQNLLNQMAQQGATQQQMNTALIAALSNAGVNTSAPAVQQAVASDVAATTAAATSGSVVPLTAGSTGLSTMTLLGIAAGGGLLLWLATRKGGGSPRRHRK